MDKIEHACMTIISELKKGAYSYAQLEFLKRFFTIIVETTDKLMKKEVTTE
uniref:Uncharacterized protein n=1 Tax=viral metagenome TaxID=1070528 RepID=A0A6M3X7W9_9ZZZZ